MDRKREIYRPKHTMVGNSKCHGGCRSSMRPAEKVDHLAAVPYDSLRL